MKKLKFSFILLAVTISYGVVGYHLTEDMSLFEALYMTMITISSVGYGEVKPLTTYGRIFTISLISIGIAIGGYTIGTLLKMLIEGELSKTFGRRKVEKKLNY